LTISFAVSTEELKLSENQGFPKYDIERDITYVAALSTSPSGAMGKHSVGLRRRIGFKTRLGHFVFLRLFSVASIAALQQQFFEVTVMWNGGWRES
jgi:hypothetical protein